MNEQIKKKIKKLLALSKSPNENEAMAALEKARKLMDEYGLNEQDFNVYTEEAKYPKSDPIWQYIIARGVAWINGTVLRIVEEYRLQVVRFHGAERDAFISKEMYQYLVKSVNRMARQNIRKNAKKPYINSYKQGMASSLYKRMLQAGEIYSWANKRESQLETIEKYVVDLYKKRYEASSMKRKKQKLNNIGFYRGANDADEINLNRQTTGGKQKCIGR